jgi:hypothetical protein
MVHKFEEELQLQLLQLVDFGLTWTLSWLWFGLSAWPLLVILAWCVIP